jgi:hypothetical protein
LGLVVTLTKLLSPASNDSSASSAVGAAAMLLA